MQEIIIYDLIGDHVTAIYKETIQGINSTAAFVQRFNTRIVIRELKQQQQRWLLEWHSKSEVPLLQTLSRLFHLL